MQAILSDVSLVVSSAISWMDSFIDTIVETPVLFLICVAMPLCSMAVNLLNRLIRL